MEGRIDRRTVIVVLLLLVGGLVVLYSASAPFSLRYFGSDVHMLGRQMIAGAVGVVALLILTFFDYHTLAVLSDLMLGGSFLLTVMTLLPLGLVDGRWIDLGVFTLQPTELVKFSLIFFLATTIVRRGERIRSFREGMFPSLFVLGVIAAVIIMQPDLGMILMLGAITMAMLFFGGASTLQLGAIGLAAVPCVYLAIVVAPYRLSRLLAFLHPESYSTSSGYQTMQSLIAVGSGGVFGRGLGASRAKLFYLPQSHNDFILSVVGEELGLLGVVAVFICLGVLAWRAYVIAQRAPDRLGRLLALGIGFAIGFQALVNAGVVLGMLPVTGLTFPFLSNGGSSLIVTLAMIGVLLNVSRQGEKR